VASPVAVNSIASSNMTSIPGPRGFKAPRFLIDPLGGILVLILGFFCQTSRPEINRSRRYLRIFKTDPTAPGSRPYPCVAYLGTLAATRSPSQMKTNGVTFRIFRP
jgi:hypothetical protein